MFICVGSVVSPLRTETNMTNSYMLISDHVNRPVFFPVTLYIRLSVASVVHREATVFAFRQDVMQSEL